MADEDYLSNDDMPRDTKAFMWGNLGRKLGHTLTSPYHIIKELMGTPPMGEGGHVNPNIIPSATNTALMQALGTLKKGSNFSQYPESNPVGVIPSGMAKTAPEAFAPTRPGGGLEVPGNANERMPNTTNQELIDYLKGTAEQFTPTAEELAQNPGMNSPVRGGNMPISPDGRVPLDKPANVNPTKAEMAAERKMELDAEFRDTHKYERDQYYKIFDEHNAYHDKMNEFSARIGEEKPNSPEWNRIKALKSQYIKQNEKRVTKMVDSLPEKLQDRLDSESWARSERLSGKALLDAWRKKFNPDEPPEDK